MAKVKPSAQSKKLNKKKMTALDSKAKNKVGINKRSGKSHSGRRRRRTLRKKTERDPTGVVYISHIPHGFYEDQIEAYFSQFGKVNAVSVPRSKTGRARGYAFIEYKYPEIAKIAADTMNNYLMLNRLLKAKYIPPEEQKPRLFRIAKAALVNHKTVADKAVIAVKHNRKLKNRHLKIGLEAKYAAKLLKKKKALMNQAEKLGLSNDIMVEETDLHSIFERKKELKASKNIKSDKQDVKSDQKEGTDNSEDQMSSSEDDDIQSLESDDFLSEDMDDVELQSESEEEDYKKVISKAKKAAKDILKKNPKPTKLQKPNKGQVVLHASSELSIQNQNKKQTSSHKEMIVENKNVLLNDNLESSKVIAKSKKQNTPLKVKLPKTEVAEDGLTQKENITPMKSKGRKSLNKNDVTGKTPTSVKKTKATIQTPTNKKSDISKIVMEVDKNDEEINFKTPPNVVKKFIKTVKDSAKKPSKKTPTKQSLSTKKKHSPKKTRPRGRSPTSGKKIRHRRSLKRILKAQ